VKVRGALLREMGLPAPYATSRPLEIAELELEEPGPGEILVRIRAAGLCHSDLSVIDGSRPRVMPMVLGHEAAGEVAEAGPDVHDLIRGDHVVLSFVPACTACPTCLAGKGWLCEPAGAANTAGTLLSGARRLHDAAGAPLNHHLGVSAFCDHAVVSAHSAVKVNTALEFEVAALFGCAVLTGVGAVINSAQVEPGETVAVFGLGGVGLAALLGARFAGAGSIVAVDRVESKLDLALELGASATLLAGPGVAEAVRELTGGGAHRVIETAGNAALLAQAYAATRRGGTVVTVGLPHPEQMLSIPAVSLVTEERTLRGSYLGSSLPSRDIPRLVAMHLEGRLPVERLLSERIGLEQINEGFDALAAGEVVRQVVVF
jgi:Zn-dependent alcohol dehydrogenase